MRATPLGRQSARWQKALGLVSLLACLLVRLEAQTALYIQDGEEGRLVQAFLRGQPLVEKNGKLVEPSGKSCFLQAVEEYIPVHIALRNWEVHTSEVVFDTGDSTNKAIAIDGELESSVNLERVFLVLDLDSEDRGKVLFGWEVGELKAREPRPFGLRVPLSVGLGQGNYRIHFYVNGREAFHSMMPMGMMDFALHRMVMKRIAEVKDAEPQPFVCLAPEFPKALKKAKTSGSVKVSFRIMPNGSVLDPKVVASTHPELIEPTLAAVRQWYFLPRVRNGQPVEAKVQIPLNFTASAK